jgi:hypothetical protein
VTATLEEAMEQVATVLTAINDDGLGVYLHSACLDLDLAIGAPLLRIAEAIDRLALAIDESRVAE